MRAFQQQGVPGILRRYQKEGGPSIDQCFDPVRAAASTPVIDLQGLLDAVIFNWLIGNNDAHGKNFSLIYRWTIESGVQTHLAPLYDLFCTAYYPELSSKMAMKLGGEYLSQCITSVHFERLAEEAGLAKPLMKRRVLEPAEAAGSKLPAATTDHPVAMAVADVIRTGCVRSVRSFRK